MIASPLRMSTSGGKKGISSSVAANVVESPYLQRIMERRTVTTATVTAEGPPFPSSYPPIEGSSMDLDLGGTGTDSREGRKDFLAFLKFVHVSSPLSLFTTFHFHQHH